MDLTIQTLSSVSPFQWAGLVFGVLYIFFAAFQKNQCWVYSIISTSCIAIEDFVYMKLYFDGALQIFYTLVAFCGLYIWWKGGTQTSQLRISKLGLSKNLGYIALCIIIALPAGYILGENSDAAYPYLDGLTSILSLVATFLLVYKIVDAWYYWIIVDVVIIYLYYSRGAPLFSLLYLIYLVFAVVGLIRWMKELNRPQVKTTRT